MFPSNVSNGNGTMRGLFVVVARGNSELSELCGSQAIIHLVWVHCLYELHVLDSRRDGAGHSLPA